MSNQPIYLETHDEVAVLVLNRPDKLNALNTDVWKGIKKFVDEVAGNPDIKVLILRGVNERAFSAGADISEFPKIHATPKASSSPKRSDGPLLTRFLSLPNL